MNRMSSDNYERVNITLPSRTLRRVDHLAKLGDRSRFIDTALNFYLLRRSRARLGKAVREGATARAKRDREIAALFDLDDLWTMQEA